MSPLAISVQPWGLRRLAGALADSIAKWLTGCLAVSGDQAVTFVGNPTTCELLSALSRKCEVVGRALVCMVCVHNGRLTSMIHSHVVAGRGWVGYSVQDV